jgi:hypothetical protein
MDELWAVPVYYRLGEPGEERLFCPDREEVVADRVSEFS